MRRALLKSRWRTAKIATVLAAVLAALTGMGATAVSAGTTTGPWSQTSYNAAQSRANLNEQILTRTTVGKVLHLRDITPPPADTTGCSAPGIVAPVLTGGRLYAVANGRLTKYNPATGTVIWQRTPDPTFSVYFRSLAVAGGLVIVGELDCGSVSDPNGFIQAFNASTGALVWSTFITPNRNGALMQLVVSGGYVVAAGASDGGGDVVSVRKLTTGASVWYRETDYCGGGGNVLVAAQLVMSIACAQNAASLTANNLATGALAWSRPGVWGLQRGDTDASTGRHLYATNPNGTVVSLNPLTGKWQYQLAGATHVLAVATSRVFADCGSLGVCAYSITSGSRQWNAQPGSATDLAASAGGVLYLDQGLALNTGTGAIMATLWVGSQASALAVGNGRIAVVTGPAGQVLKLYGLPGY